MTHYYCCNKIIFHFIIKFLYNQPNGKMLCEMLSWKGITKLYFIIAFIISLRNQRNTKI